MEVGVDLAVVAGDATKAYEQLCKRSKEQDGKNCCQKLFKRQRLGMHEERIESYICPDCKENNHRSPKNKGAEI